MPYDGTRHIIGLKPSTGTDIQQKVESSARTRVIEYCGIIQNIIKLDYRRFNVYVFDVRWLKDVMGKVPQCSIKADSSGLTTIDTTSLCSAKEGTFILPFHCEQVLIIIFIYILII